MQKVPLWLGVGAVAVVAGTAAAFYAFTSPDTSGGAVSNADDSAIRTQVTEFGARLQQVSLLEPTAQLTADMHAQYASYVAPELLANWAEHPDAALGRQTSSPWPDRIEVVSVDQSADTATVEGNIIEVVNGQNNATAIAAVQPVTLSLEKRDGHWLITGATKGSYSEVPQQKTITGTWECLPHKDTTGPQTLECAFGIAVDQSDGHYAVDTSRMETPFVDVPTGTKVRVTGLVVPADQLNSLQKYDIDGVIQATAIERAN